MNAEQAQKLKVGDAVILDGDPEGRGEITVVGYSGFEIEWERKRAIWYDFVCDAGLVARIGVTP